MNALVIFLIRIIDLAANIIYILVIVKVVLSYFMSPFHPLRATIDRLIEPLLAPIRRYIPQTGMLDFSPMVLLILIWLVNSILQSLLLSMV